MPTKKYFRKINRSAWSEEDIKKAMKAVEQKTHSFKKAAILHEICYLVRQIEQHIYPTKKIKLEKNPVLNENLEREMANHKLSNMF